MFGECWSTSVSITKSPILRWLQQAVFQTCFYPPSALKISLWRYKFANRKSKYCLKKEDNIFATVFKRDKEPLSWNRLKVHRLDFYIRMWTKVNAGEYAFSKKNVFRDVGKDRLKFRHNRTLEVQNLFLSNFGRFYKLTSCS